MGKTYYKVVRERDGRLISAVDFENDVIVEYHPDEFVVGRFGPLFIFRKLENAQNFFRDRAFPIWECEATGVRRVKHILIWYNCYEEMLSKFWRERSRIKDRKRLTQVALVGTLLADSVKLTRYVCLT